MFDRARPTVGEDGPYEKARQRQRRRERRERSAIPDWFSAEDLIAGGVGNGGAAIPLTHTREGAGSPPAP